MRLVLFSLLLISFSAQATPLMNMKDRLRLHLWTFGLEEELKMIEKKPREKKHRPLPEEIERALRKI